MIKQLTNEELAQIRERVEKATKGPWETSTSGDGIKAGKYHIGVISKPHYFPYGLGTKEDASFIAHAREDIPKLLAEVERLSNRIQHAEEILKLDTELIQKLWEVADIDEEK